MNKFLIVQAQVVLTPIIEPVITALDRYFEAANHKAMVTSGKRDPEDQLRIIRNYLTKKGLAEKYPEAMTCGLQDKDTAGNYLWQMAWSNLLNVGIIINPPLRAKCLMDYTGKSGKNLKGVSLYPSVHFQGTAFDIGGAGNGIADEAAIVQKALDDKMAGLASTLVERENNCLHCNCVMIVPPTPTPPTNGKTV